MEERVPPMELGWLEGCQPLSGAFGCSRSSKGREGGTGFKWATLPNWLSMGALPHLMAGLALHRQSRIMAGICSDLPRSRVTQRQ